MPDTKTTLTWTLKDEVSGPARGLGATLGGLVNPATLAVGAVVGLGAALLGAAQAAAEEEINVKKLDAALVANIPNWGGNTDAIEELISKRENLAFSDDELRASMAALVTSTKDVAEAQNLQAIAMDLARLKGVSLETATIAVAKASQGSTRELKAMGLEIDESATAAENLATIAAAAAGQSEAYASTTQGKWETLQTKFGDVVEKVGSALLPILMDLADFAIETLIPAIEDFADVVGPILSAAFRTVGGTIGWFVDTVVKPAIDFISSLIGFIKDAIGFFENLIGAKSRAGSATTAYSRRLPGRQAGGEVEPGEAYLVGETGPEVLVMGNRGGMVIPGEVSRGSETVIHIPVYLDGQLIADIVDRHLGGRPQSSSSWS